MWVVAAGLVGLGPWLHYSHWKWNCKYSFLKYTHSVVYTFLRLCWQAMEQSTHLEYAIKVPWWASGCDSRALSFLLYFNLVFVFFWFSFLLLLSAQSNFRSFFSFFSFLLSSLLSFIIITILISANVQLSILFLPSHCLYHSPPFLPSPCSTTPPCIFSTTTPHWPRLILITISAHSIRTHSSLLPLAHSYAHTHTHKHT